MLLAVLISHCFRLLQTSSISVPVPFPSVVTLPFSHLYLKFFLHRCYRVIK